MWSLAIIVSTSSQAKCVFLSNHKCEIQAILIYLYSNTCNQVLHNWAFTVKLDRCVGSYNTLIHLANKICVPNKTEDLNLSIFKMITGINKLNFQHNIYNANVNIKLIEGNVKM